MPHIWDGGNSLHRVTKVKVISQYSRNTSTSTGKTEQFFCSSYRTIRMFGYFLFGSNGQHGDSMVPDTTKDIQVQNFLHLYLASRKQKYSSMSSASARSYKHLDRCPLLEPGGFGEPETSSPDFLPDLPEWGTPLEDQFASKETGRFLLFLAWCEVT